MAFFSKIFQKENGDIENNTDLETKTLTSSIKKNISMIKNIFLDVDTVEYRDITGGEKNSDFCIIFNDGVVDAQMMDEYILKPIMQYKGEVTADNILNKVVQINSAEKISDFKSIVEAISYGDTILLIENSNEALLLDTKNFLLRAIEEPDGEKVLSGPREGFCEAILINLSLVRRKIRSNQLKFKYLSLGTQTATQICISYMDNIVDKDLVKDLEKRLEKIDMDCILDANYIEELISDTKLSVFRSVGSTERPDVIAAKLLEGRIAIFIDGTPVVLTLPYLFIENFQSSEDYYMNFYYTSFSRLLRIIGFLLTITVPAMYIAIVAYHQEMLPTNLMINIATDSHNVPLPAALEALILLVMFDILRETGVRMSSRVGQALSIVGALVVGQAAVEAKLIAAPMLIIVALTGITSLLVPKLNTSVIFIRVGILLPTAFLGLLGFTVSLTATLINILTLKSCGISQMTRDDRYSSQANKDSLIRMPWKDMIERPAFLTNNHERMN